MNTLRAIIIDDERRGISTLKQLVEKYVANVQIIEEFMDAAEAIPVIEQQKPEILFLDIDMPQMNGFEMLDKLSWKDFSLVFTTAHVEYGLKALKNNAIDYLLKPIDYKQLQNTIDRIRQKRNENLFTVRFSYEELIHSLKRPKQRLLVHSVSGAEYIDLEDIVGLESRSNYTCIILGKGSQLLTRKTLKEFETQLGFMSTNFMRVHHSFIINLEKVERYLKASDEIVLSGEVLVPLSKARRDAFFSWMNI
jgi:two-component system LytT family response regulator